MNMNMPFPLTRVYVRSNRMMYPFASDNMGKIYISQAQGFYPYEQISVILANNTVYEDAIMNYTIPTYNQTNTMYLVRKSKNETYLQVMLYDSYGPAAFVPLTIYSNRSMMMMQSDLSGYINITKMSGFQSGEMISL